MASKVYARPIGYQFQDFLGEGLNSCVYRAIRSDEEFGVSQSFAVKILKSEKLVALWRNEIEQLSRVRSPHCVSLLGWEIIHDRPALVLEYVEGLTLDEILEEARFSPAAVDELFRQALAGLCDLRDAAVFHGDLNLHNIMIDVSGLVKLVDFGVFDEGGCYATPAFAAREVLAGQRPTFETDVYSLNMVQNEVIRRLGLQVQSKEFSQKENQLARHELGQVVSHVLTRRRNRRQRTVRIQKEKSLASYWTKSVGILLLTLIAVFPFCTRGDQELHREDKSAQVFVRTKSWIIVGIQGRTMSYGPTQFRLKGNQTVRLRWQSATASGQTPLTPKPGELIVLDEAFFKRHSNLR